MSVLSRVSTSVAMAVVLACGPTDDAPELDPEEVFTAFCSTLFACPDVTDAMDTYGSRAGCEDVHRMDHEMRNATCRPRVLMLEDCLATLTCLELDDYVQATGSACDEERFRLLEECAPL
jgi:hypothetical protein